MSHDNQQAEVRVGDRWAHRSDGRTLEIHAVPSAIVGASHVDVVLLTNSSGLPMPSEPYVQTDVDIMPDGTYWPIERTVYPFTPQAWIRTGLLAEWEPTR